MAADYPLAIPNFTGTTETAPATTTPSPLAAWATKVKDEIVARAVDKALSIGPYTSGLWYAPEMTGIGGTAIGTGALVLTRYDFPPGTTCVGLAGWVTVAGGAGALHRCCIYSDDGTGYPGALLKDAGTYDGTVTGFRQAGGADFTAVNISGVTWIGGVSTVAAPTLAVVNSQGRTMGMSTVAVGNSVWAGWLQTGVTGALPATFTATRATNAQTPRIFVKIG